MRSLPLVFLTTAIFSSGAASATVLLQTSAPGYYNNSIGTLLNGTNGGDTATGYFPISNDAAVDFAIAPNLSAAGAVLGNWLTDPGNLNAFWSFETSIPSTWTIGSEVAVVYRFDTLSATNVVASFGVDNGIFAWLDGHFLGGARRSGDVVANEHVFNVGSLSGGTHYLQLLLEDHGGAAGYSGQITGTTSTQVPEPTTFALVGLGLLTLAFGMRRKA